MKPKKILARLEAVIGVNGAPRRLKESIEIELKTHFRIPEIRAVELAEELEKSIEKLIEQTRLDRENSGTLPTLILSDINTRMVMGSCWLTPNDTPDVIAAKSRRIYVEPLYQAIRSLTFNEFEVFGAKILHELGAAKVCVTPHSVDQGIDFYGVLSLGSFSKVPSPFLQLAHDIQIRFAGQAKHYPNSPIGPDVIRELVGAIELARHKVFSVEADLFEDLELRAFNPLLAMIFTTGRFTRGAQELTRKSGIIARSGEQLSVFLADRGIGVRQDENNIQFDPKLFQEWLNS
jgi:HJR/Mrr/RecB family endonuclease